MKPSESSMRLDSQKNEKVVKAYQINALTTF